MFKSRSKLVFVLIIGAGLYLAAAAQPQQQAPQKPVDVIQKRLTNLEQSLSVVEHSLKRSMEDEALARGLQDLAEMDKIRYTGPPPRVIKNPTAPGAKNNVVLTAYTFLPKKYLTAKKLPLMILVHGGIHGSFDSSHLHILRELLQQGYAVVGPDYRGSTGYGLQFQQLIDYGGLEVEDVFAAGQWMLENHANLDPEHVGIMGWSHGGLITLMNLFNHPKAYKAGYASVPVCDLVARMGYKGKAYEDLFSAPYHIGKTVAEDVEEYRRRSPAWNAHKLQSPLLIHTTTNDEDVHVLEVENLIKSLKAADKKFEHKIYQDAPGGHDFNRIDTKFARDPRAEAYQFLAKHLNPPNPVK